MPLSGVMDSHLPVGVAYHELEFSDTHLRRGEGMTVKVTVRGPAAGQKTRTGGGGVIIGDLMLVLENSKKNTQVVVRKRSQTGAGRPRCQKGCVILAGEAVTLVPAAEAKLDYQASPYRDVTAAAACQARCRESGAPRPLAWGRVATMPWGARVHACMRRAATAAAPCM